MIRPKSHGPFLAELGLGPRQLLLAAITPLPEKTLGRGNVLPPPHPPLNGPGP